VKTLNDLDQQHLTELQALLHRAELGDQAALADLKKTLDDIPEISKRYGDLGQIAIQAWLKVVAGPNLLLQETLNRQLDEMRNELQGGADAPLLERLLVDQILCCWIQARHVDAIFAQGTSPATPLQLDKRQTGAHHRFIKSVQALATLRKLLRVVPSPVQIASRLTVKNQPPRRVMNPACAVAIEN
jgi:hypothetical protein